MMKCEEFKEKIVSLFDKDIDPSTRAEIEQHLAECPTCKLLYEELAETYRSLIPQAEPENVNIASAMTRLSSSPHSQSAIAKVQATRHKYWNIAAAVAIFFSGIAIGWSHLFSTTATAHEFTLQQGIQNVRNVGSFDMDIYVRTMPNENFAYFDPKADFVRTRIVVLRQNDSTFYRVAKDGGRTVVFDGCHQYMWIPKIQYLKGSPNADFLERFRNLLYPERILAMQEEAIGISKVTHVGRQETDSTIVINTEGLEKKYSLQELLATGHMGECKVTMQNVFSKNDGLLRSVKLWIEYNDKQILMLHIDGIRYNTLQSRSTVIALPQVTAEKWQDISKQERMTPSRQLSLQHESPEQAAKRILHAIITGNQENAQEALKYYTTVFGKLHSKFNGCKVSDFKVKQDTSYPGYYVFYTLTNPDGTTEQTHICVRNDNDNHVWIADGGL